MSVKTLTGVTSEVVSLAEAKAHLRVSSNLEDTYISSLIPVARGAVEQELGRSIGEQTLLLQLDSFPMDEETGGSSPIQLLRPPLVIVNSVEYTDEAGVSQVFAAPNYFVDDSQVYPWVLLEYEIDWPDTQDSANAVRVTYLAGYSAANCPAEIKHSILMVIGDLFENREQSGESLTINDFVKRLSDGYRTHPF